MPKIIIDGKEVECRPGIPVLQAALEAGMAIPHYCYHPGLTIVASCRLCLMEMKMPHPKTKEMVWVPKLFPSCQTPVKDGMEVRFECDAVANNTRHVMEYYLVNHPLDCPVCDKAGECYLQDYTEEHGSATSRMVEEKSKNPKKDIGSHTLLYQDRCVLCTRCVRFTQEIAGSGELCVVNRGNRGEIDVFPGEPLENPLQGNVVDLCPVGALLDKGFLFKQRVWLLKSTASISPSDSRGSTIWIDHNENRIHRIRPRFNEKVNEWWISDESRFDWRYVHSPDRIREPLVRLDGQLTSASWEDVRRIIPERLAEAAAGDDGASVAVVLSPMMTCEEAWLLTKFVRTVAPRASLVLGHVPIDGNDQQFPKGFVIKAEKCPNRRGIETIIGAMAGPTATFDEFVPHAGAGRFKAVFVVGGYPKAWLSSEQAAALGKTEFIVTLDLFSSALDAFATIRLPGATWAEREGTYMNCDGLIQPFDRALAPLDGLKNDGQFFYELAGMNGLFRSQRVREQMAVTLSEFGAVFEPRPEPEHAH